VFAGRSGRRSGRRRSELRDAEYLIDRERHHAEHEPHNRRLADDPDEFRDHMPSICEQCGGAFPLDAQKDLIGEYDEIEIPPVKPYVIRHRRFACRCAHCGVAAKAPAPAVATTTPFGPRIHALAIYLKGFQALSYERLRGLFGDAFGLRVSEGALMNMFIRSHPRFEIEAEKAKAIVRAAQVCRQRRDRRSDRRDEFLSLGFPLQGRGRASA